MHVMCMEQLIFPKESVLEAPGECVKHELRVFERMAPVAMAVSHSMLSVLHMVHEEHLLPVSH
jgi:hypothetical protein